MLKASLSGLCSAAKWTGSWFVAPQKKQEPVSKPVLVSAAWGFTSNFSIKAEEFRENPNQTFDVAKKIIEMQRRLDSKKALKPHNSDSLVSSSLSLSKSFSDETNEPSSQERKTSSLPTSSKVKGFYESFSSSNSVSESPSELTSELEPTSLYLPSLSLEE